MTTSKSIKAYQKIVLFMAFLLITVLHFSVTFVVILFALSTLNIINRSLLHIKNLNYFEIVISAAIFIISALVFLKSLKKISRFIKQTIFKNHPP